MQGMTLSPPGVYDADMCCLALARTAFAPFAILLVAAMPAQELRLRDGPHFPTSVTDTARGRIVVLGLDGDTREWDGQRWLRRPFASPRGFIPVFDMPVFDATTRRVLAVM